MTTRIVLARHGETIWHHENRYAGISDVPLTATGRAQATELGEWARTAQLDSLWVSPLSRARDTAAAVERAIDMVAQVDERLREMDFGEGDGLTLAEMAERFNDRVELFTRDPVANYLPGGENPEHAAERATRCLREIASKNPGGRVLVVAHNTLYRLVLCRLLEIPMARYRTAFAPVRNDALTEIGIDGDDAMLLQFNVPVRLA